MDDDVYKLAESGREEYARILILKSLTAFADVGIFLLYQFADWVLLAKLFVGFRNNIRHVERLEKR